MIRELEEFAFAQEISWRQKSRVLWLEERDSNTKFFHRVAVATRRRNFVESVEVNGVVHVGEEEVEGAIVDYYKWLCGEEEGHGCPGP